MQTRVFNLDLSQTDTAGTRRVSLQRERTIKPFRCVCDVMTSLMNLEVVSAAASKRPSAPC